MPPVGFEPATPASERPHTHASDRAATVIGEATNETTQNKQKTNILALNGIRTRDHSNQKAADLRLRTHSQCGRLVLSPISYQRFT